MPYFQEHKEIQYTVNIWAGELHVRHKIQAAKKWGLVRRICAQFVYYPFTMISYYTDLKENTQQPLI